MFCKYIQSILCDLLETFLQNSIKKLKTKLLELTSCIPVMRGSNLNSTEINAYDIPLYKHESS